MTSLRDAGNDRWTALPRLARNSLADLDYAQSIARGREGLITYGYVRSGIAC